MLASFALSSSAAKRLIAMGVCGMDQIKQALDHGRIIIAGGTTNAFIVEELGISDFDNKSLYTAGIITGGRPCVTPAQQRITPICLEKGIRIQIPWEEFLQEFGRDDVFIKGANALDSTGKAGILAGSPFGGTIGTALGTLAARGAGLIVPVGHEKMIPSCELAARTLGICRLDRSLGMKTGFIMLPYGQVVTEINALETLYQVAAYVVAAGGVGGMEGSVTVAVEGSEEKVSEILKLAKKLMKEKPLQGVRASCKNCSYPCDFGAPGSP